MKILRIGDPHIKPSNLEDAENLMHFINDTILERQPNRVEILGDLFHTHSIVRLEVMEFWMGWMDVLVSHENIEFYVLRGNHDMAGPEENSPSALMIFKDMWRKHKNLHIVENPHADPKKEGLFAYVSYYHDQDTFIEVANNCAKEGAKVLVCHQTFGGANYETGIAALDGIDVAKLNFDLIISGHIHTHQDIIKEGKRILYPGTAKWDTASDANENKGIWMYEHDDVTGAILSEELISTERIVTPIINLTWIEGTQQPMIPTKGHKTTVNLVGSAKWIAEESAKLKGLVEITSKTTDKVERKDRNAGRNFADFVAHKFNTDLDKKELLLYMRGLNLV